MKFLLALLAMIIVGSGFMFLTHLFYLKCDESSSIRNAIYTTLFSVSCFITALSGIGALIAFISACISFL